MTRGLSITDSGLYGVFEFSLLEGQINSRLVYLSSKFYCEFEVRVVLVSQRLCPLMSLRDPVNLFDTAYQFRFNKNM